MANPWNKNTIKINSTACIDEDIDFDDSLYICASFKLKNIMEDNIIIIKNKFDNLKTNILSFKQTFNNGMPIILELIKSENFKECNELNCIIIEQKVIIKIIEELIKFFKELDFIDYSEKYSHNFYDLSKEYVLLMDNIYKLINKLFIFIKNFHKCDAGIILYKYIFNKYDIFEEIFEEIKIKKDIIDNIINPPLVVVKKVSTTSQISYNEILTCFGDEDSEFLIDQNGFANFGFDIIKYIKYLQSIKTEYNSSYIVQMPFRYKQQECKNKSLIKNHICRYHYNCTFLHYNDNITFEDSDINFIKKSVYWLLSIIVKMQIKQYDADNIMESFKRLFNNYFFDDSEGQKWFRNVTEYYCPIIEKSKNNIKSSNTKNSKESESFDNMYSVLSNDVKMNDIVESLSANGPAITNKKPCNNPSDNATKDTSNNETKDPCNNETEDTSNNETKDPWKDE